MSRAGLRCHPHLLVEVKCPELNRQEPIRPARECHWTAGHRGDGVGNPIKMHANRELITGVLKGRLHFRGFVISDWEGIHQIPDPSNPDVAGLTPYKVRVGVNAGTDMFMEPNSAAQFEELLLAEVNAGRVSMARINDAVGRILQAKFRLELFEHPFASMDNLDQVGSTEHRAIARRAAAESQVLLKNSGKVLPLSPSANVYVAGRNADNIGNQAGGWTITWQGVSGDAIPGTTILEGIREVAPNAKITYSADASAPTAGADVGVVVVGETPYAEGYGDLGGPQAVRDARGPRRMRARAAGGPIRHGPRRIPDILRAALHREGLGGQGLQRGGSSRRSALGRRRRASRGRAREQPKQTGPGGQTGAATGSSAADSNPNVDTSEKSLPGPASDDPTSTNSKPTARSSTGSRRPQTTPARSRRQEHSA